MQTTIRCFVLGFAALYGALAHAVPYTFSTLVSFNGTNAKSSIAPLILDSAGNLYGTSQTGGTGHGNVFEVAAGTHAVTSLASFKGTNGERPDGGLLFDANRNLYGTTEAGGTSSWGTIFQVAANTHALTTLVNLDGHNGNAPNAGLIADSGGNLFGTTYAGGANGNGNVFEVAAGTNAISTLVSFNGANGNGPVTSLVFDSNGNLFGTTAFGGANGLGIVFEVEAVTNALTTLVTFNGANGSEPRGGFTIDGSGNLFGTTRLGGTNNLGTVFEIAAGSHALTTLATFNGPNGSQPYAGLIEDAHGNLFGTTTIGGSAGLGVVFEVAAGSHALSTLATFDGTNGSKPYGGLVADANGNLYGTTNTGGASNRGVVYQLTPVPVPEPGSLLLAGCGAALLVLATRNLKAEMPWAA